MPVVKADSFSIFGHGFMPKHAPSVITDDKLIFTMDNSLASAPCFPPWLPTSVLPLQACQP